MTALNKSFLRRLKPEFTRAFVRGRVICVYAIAAAQPETGQIMRGLIGIAGSAS
jgi:hypothetical protein